MVISPGVVPALNRLVPLLTLPEETVLIATPSYAPFKGACDMNNRNLVTTKLLYEDGKYVVDFHDMESKILDPGNRIKLFILCNPHNPTGRAWSREELLHIGKLCLEHGIWIISDEVHCDLLRTGKKHIPLAALFPDTDRIITCTSPSKTFNLAGNLVSHIFIKNDAIRKEWRRIYFDLLSPLSIAATKAAYKDGSLWLGELTAYLDDNFKKLDELLKDLLPEAIFTVPEATYLGWVNLSAYFTSLSATERPSLYLARTAGVIAEDEYMFVANAEGCIRLNIACPRSVMEKGVQRIAKVLTTR